MGKNKNFARLNPQNILAFLFQEERRSSILLLGAAAAALIITNSSWSSEYLAFFSKELTLGSVTLDIQHWINEGLMALFFLVVVLEVKREFIDGELSTWRKASFPVIAAIGGMLVPALIFTTINPYPPENSGWAIPMATDIAISVGIIGLLGRGVPRSLRIFLLALAIVDDVGSILVIGLFYSQPSNMFALMLAVGLSLVLFSVKSKPLRGLSFPVLGLAIWYCLLVAGVSGTMAGVVVAAMAPLTKRRSNAKRLQVSEIVEDVLLPITAYIIVPLFVFANAGLNFASVALSDTSNTMVFLGIFLGLLIGKPVGILTASYIATLLRLAHKPSNASWKQISGIGFVAGIGFTVSLLIADLSYRSLPNFQNSAVLGVFAASIISGFIGILILKLARRTPAA